MELKNEFTSISEAQFIPGSDTFLIKIIGPGWGSSGYYSKEVLRSAARLYRVGTHMYLNHSTRSELKERPERDINDLTGYLNRDAAWWDESGPMGAGLYQEARVFSKNLEFIKNAAKIIGISHNVLGKTRNGIADGRTGPIVDSIDEVISVDFVTRPGAGGAIITEGSRTQTGRIKTVSSIDTSVMALYESYRQNMSDDAARIVIHTLTGFQIPDEKRPGVTSGSLTEAAEMLVQSYMDSGMRRETAVKLVKGL